MGGLDQFLALLSGPQPQAVSQGPPQPTPTLQPTPQSQLPMSPQAIEDLRRHAQLLQGAGVSQHIPLSRGWGAITQGMSGLMGGLEQRDVANALNQRQQGIAEEVQRDPMTPPASSTTATSPSPAYAPSQSGAVGSPEDVEAIKNAASWVGISPRDLTAAMHFESGLNPNLHSGSYKDGSGKGDFWGLIGFDKDNRKQYGVTDNMTIAEQMPKVAQYLKDRGVKPGMGLEDVYTAINAGHTGVDPSGVPYIDRSDANGPIRRHIATIQHGSYGPADRFLSGGNSSVSSTLPANPNVQQVANVVGGGATQQPSPLQNPQQVAQVVSGQQQPSTAAPNYPQMVREQTARLIRKGMDAKEAGALATSMVEGNLKYQPQFSQPDEYGNVTKTVAGQPPTIHIHGSPILESYEPVKGVHQYRLKYRDPMTGVTTMQPADASGKPQGPALALGQGTGPPSAVAQAPLGAPPGATVAPAAQPATVGPSPVVAGAQSPVVPPPKPAAPAWPQTPPLGMAEGMAPGGTSAAQQIAARSGIQPPTDWMSALRTPPPGPRPMPAPGIKVAGPVASLPPPTAPIPPSQPRTEGTLSAPSGVPPMPTGADATPENLTNWQQAVEQEAERRKEVGKKGGEAMMVPIGEAMKEAKTAPQMLNALNVIEDVAKTHGDKIVTGGLGEPYMRLAQTVNGVAKMFGADKDVLGDTANPETMKKMNAFLASAATQAMTARGTQFDFATNMRAMPGNLENSMKGTLWLTSILKQITQQNLQLSRLAANKNNWDNWGDVQEKFYNEHKILNPATGNELGVMDEAKAPQPESSSATAIASMSPGPTHIQALKANPHKRDEFDEKFGPGAANKVLGQTVPMSR